MQKKKELVLETGLTSWIVLVVGTEKKMGATMQFMV